MKKKIFFVMSTDDFSGAENINFSIINNLKDDFDFYWVSKKGRINSFLEEENIKWIEIKKLSVWEIKRVIKEYKPDILHATDFTASCICAMTNTKIPIISHLHHNAHWLKKINLKTVLYLVCSLRINKILTVSDSIENEYIFSSLIKNKIECIGNPISVDKIRNMVDERDYEKKYDICCIGRLTDAKNPLRWLKIVNEIKKDIPNIKCIWLGDGELKKIFEDKIIEYGLTDNIIMTGFRKNPYKFLASSKIYLQTSSWEGFGLSAFEALALGVPAFVSNVGGLPIIVDDTCGKLCDTDQDFLKTVLDVLFNPVLLNKKIANSKKKAEKLDNSLCYFAKIKDFYSKFL